jgi:ferredoxin
MIKRVAHVVHRRGKTVTDPDIDIPVADDLVAQPGARTRDIDVSFYSRVEPLSTPDVEKTADADWAWMIFPDDLAEYRRGHNERSKPHLRAAETSADIEPTGVPNPGVDLTELIRDKARELGFNEVGFTRYDNRYTFAHRKGWPKFQNAICLALEQDYRQTQTIPSLEGEIAHFGTYEIEAEMAIELSDYIRSLGYHAQMHLDSADSGAYIPMFVNAGLGQLGANGQLLSPHFGSRSRLAMLTTDAPVTYDDPVDYGMFNFCQVCQVCVNRCPGRALIRDKVWYRGVQKNKVIYERCRPVMANHDGCGICVKVCPIQRYGMKPVMEHYVETGDVLGKGTDNLEGYSFRNNDYFGAGKLPHFSPQFFDIPNCRPEQLLFDQFKAKVQSEQMPKVEEIREFALEVKKAVERGKGQPYMKD